ncbi:hypothetical protein PQX77_007616 [Marasmius sp. AFHP31]|nr:hypothetical protein PQX77_007616 [Marasmius sp. AFHP31]
MGDPTFNPSMPPEIKPSPEGCLESVSLGVHRVFLAKDSFDIDFLRHGAQALKNWKRHLSLATRLLTELACFDRKLLIHYIVLETCLQLEKTVLLSIEVYIMRTIEAGVVARSIDRLAVAKALVLRTFVVAVFSIAGRLGERFGRDFQVGVNYHYEEILFKDKLVDIVTLEDDDEELHGGITSDIPWRAFHRLVCFYGYLVGFVGNAVFIGNIVRRDNHGFVLVLLCLVPTFLESLLTKNMWILPRITQAVNPHYLRMRSLLNLAHKKHRYDILSGNVSRYLYSEYSKACRAVGSVSLDTPENIYRRDNLSWVATTLSAISGDFTMIYHASLTIFVSHRASLALFTAIRHVAPTLLPCFSSIFHSTDELIQSLSQLQDLYNIQARKSQRQVNGNLRYPNSAKESTCGMKLELRSDSSSLDTLQPVMRTLTALNPSRNVTFSYPGTPDQKALDSVSAKIGPGQLVAIVGSNGSGKSTLINLLTRMYDPRNGQVLVDGTNLKRLEIESFRDATTVLTQEHLLYPGMSIGENIAIGRPELVMDEEEIMDAARKSGADRVITKFGAKGLSGLSETIIDPFREQALRKVDTQDQKHPLNKLWKRLQKGRNLDVSGGERQRLVA